GQGGVAVLYGLHPVALGDQAVGQGEDEARLVLDQEDARPGGALRALHKASGAPAISSPAPTRSLPGPPEPGATGRRRGEAPPPPRPGAGGDRAALDLDDPAHEREAQTAPGHPAPRRHLPAAVERLEEVRPVQGGNARPPVFDREAHLPAAPPPAHQGGAEG